MKKILSILASAVMALVLFVGTGLTVNAAPGDGTNTGDITLKNTIKDADYKVYRIFDATYSDDAVSYTIPNGSKLPVNDAEFKAVFKTTKNGGLTYVEKTAGATDERVINYLNGLTDEQLGKTVITGKGNGASIVLATGSVGYYLVKGTDGTKSGVTITTAHPTAKVESKIDETPSITDDGKMIKTGGTNDNPTWGHFKTSYVGNNDKFKIEFTALNSYVTTENGVKQSTPITSYTIHDTSTGYSAPSSAASYTVKVGNTTLPYVEGRNAQIPENSAYFTLENVDNNENNATTKSFDIIIHNYEKGVEGVAFENPSTVTIIYDANLTSQNLNGETENKVHVKYNNVDIEKEPTTYTYNYKLTVNKVDANELSKKLPDAQFVLKNTDGSFYKVEHINAPSGVERDIVSFVSDQSDATVFTTDANGVAKATVKGKTYDAFVGLESGKYTLVEVKAPAGYTLAADRDVTLNAITQKTDVTSLAQSATVEDTAGSTLPSTGGIGTTIFYVAGAALIVAAAVILIGKKKAAQN